MPAKKPELKAAADKLNAKIAAELPYRRVYVCSQHQRGEPECIFQTGKRSVIITHLRLHELSPGCPQCARCGYMSDQLPNVIHHLVTHTKDRPHKCDVPGCEGESFRSPCQLTRHRKAKHRGIQFPSQKKKTEMFDAGIRKKTTPIARTDVGEVPGTCRRWKCAATATVGTLAQAQSHPQVSYTPQVGPSHDAQVHVADQVVLDAPVGPLLSQAPVAEGHNEVQPGSQALAALDVALAGVVVPAPVTGAPERPLDMQAQAALGCSADAYPQATIAPYVPSAGASYGSFSSLLSTLSSSSSTTMDYISNAFAPQYSGANTTRYSDTSTLDPVPQYGQVAPTCCSPMQPLEQFYDPSWLSASSSSAPSLPSIPTPPVHDLLPQLYTNMAYSASIDLPYTQNGMQQFGHSQHSTYLPPSGMRLLDDLTFGQDQMAFGADVSSGKQYPGYPDVQTGLPQASSNASRAILDLLRPY
ncbi:hypothetical protein OBBRIDRAFT_826428 [Obba rivulosa]|uniref:C2H2-type domain-containing protein n=1 Tax=Obba rivulosa TaxID=1052685 RepID=A0A8E2AWL7_9APHY|nr:hypothetical protein OBBRIDRAFT_826428 [Obba rivulosa]